MKNLLVSAVALATLIASPAFAASRVHQVQGYGAYAAARGVPVRTAYAGPDAVVFGNRVIGQDVDPNIRTQLLHDPLPSEY